MHLFLPLMIVVLLFLALLSVFLLSSPRERGYQGMQPGVGTPDGYDEEEMETKWRFHNYYQWVVFFLFFQVCVCVCVCVCVYLIAIYRKRVIPIKLMVCVCVCVFAGRPLLHPQVCVEQL